MFICCRIQARDKYRIYTVSLKNSYDILLVDTNDTVYTELCRIPAKERMQGPDRIQGAAEY